MVYDGWILNLVLLCSLIVVIGFWIMLACFIAYFFAVANIKHRHSYVYGLANENEIMASAADDLKLAKQKWIKSPFKALLKLFMFFLLILIWQMYLSKQG